MLTIYCTNVLYLIFHLVWEITMDNFHLKTENGKKFVTFICCIVLKVLNVVLRCYLIRIQLTCTKS